MKSKKSTYFFIGRLSDYTAQYQVQNFFVNSNFVLEVFMSGISIWGSSKGTFEELRKKIIQMLDIIIAAYIFKTNKIISYRLEHWVETREKVSRKNMIGWIRPPNTPAVLRSTRSSINTPWKKAAKLYAKLLVSNPNYAIALQDYSLAVSHIGDDAFFFAYRAIEDICRAVTGLDNTKSRSWNTMHTKLSTSEPQIKPLKNVADDVRHGKRKSLVIKRARKQKGKIIKISHTIIEKAFKKEFPDF